MMKRIMAAIDQSAPALRAAELATDIAIKFEAELVLLTVVRPVDDQDPTLESYLQAEHIHDPIGVVIADAARSQLRSLRDRLAQRLGRSVACEVVTGDPAEMIVSYATRTAIDLIVMGHVGHGRFADVVLGSVAKTVIDAASCPVLVAH
jgi:nucleotide-binding universal stress UspA family protein